MAHKDMIMYREAGKVVPDPVLEAILKKYPTCAGMGFLEEGLLEMDLVAPVPLTAIRKTLELYKDTGVLLTFGDYPTGYHEDDMQPFVVLQDNNKVIALAFVQGDFPGFIQADSARSAQYFFAEKHIIPTLAEVWAFAEKDFARFKGLLKKGMIKNGMMAGAVLKANVVLMLNDGELQVYSKDGDPVKTDYGWTTDTNLTQVKAAAKEEKTPVKNKAGFQKATAAAEPPPEPEPEVEEAEVPAEPDVPDEVEVEEVPDTKVAPQAPKTLTAPKALGQVPQYCERRPDNTIWFVPPVGVHGNALKKLYNRIAGILPDEGNFGHWKHARPAVPVQKARLKGFEALALAAAPKEPKPEKQTPVKPAEPAKEKDKPASSVPITGKTAIQKMDDMLKSPKIIRVLDDLSNTIVSPQSLAASERKKPDFADTFGLPGLHSTAKWTEALLEPMEHDSLVQFALWWKHEALKRFTEDELKAINPVVEPNLTGDNKDTKKVHPAVARRLERLAGKPAM